MTCFQSFTSLYNKINGSKTKISIVLGRQFRYKRYTTIISQNFQAKLWCKIDVYSTPFSLQINFTRQTATDRRPHSIINNVFCKIAKYLSGMQFLNALLIQNCKRQLCSLQCCSFSYNLRLYISFAVSNLNGIWRKKNN